MSSTSGAAPTYSHGQTRELETRINPFTGAADHYNRITGKFLSAGAVNPYFMNPSGIPGIPRLIPNPGPPVKREYRSGARDKLPNLPKTNESKMGGRRRVKKTMKKRSGKKIRRTRYRR